MKLCPHCSHQLEDEDVRCGNCSGWVVPNRKGKGKKGRSGKPNLKRVLFLLAVCALAWVVWTMPEAIPNPSEILNQEPSRAGVLATIKSDLERLQALQETHFRDFGEYSGNPEDLGFLPSERVNLSIIATPTGWSGASTHQDFPTDFGCAVFEGSAHPPPAPLTPSTPGEIACSGGS